MHRARISSRLMMSWDEVVVLVIVLAIAFFFSGEKKHG